MEKERRSWSIAAEENQVRGGGGDEGEDGGGGGGDGGDVHPGGQRIDGVLGHCHQGWPSNLLTMWCCKFVLKTNFFSQFEHSTSLMVDVSSVLLNLLLQTNPSHIEDTAKYKHGVLENLSLGFVCLFLVPAVIQYCYSHSFLVKHQLTASISCRYIHFLQEVIRQFKHCWTLIS